MIKKIFIVLIVVLGVGTLLLFQKVQKASQQINQLVYEDIDMNNMQDGIYDGQVETELIKVYVQVEVKDHQIKSIDILQHDNGFGDKANDIVNQMIKENDYRVDTISGATLSSQVIQSAVSQALKKGE